MVEEEEELTEGFISYLYCRQKVSELEAKLVSTQDEMSSTTDIGAGSAHGSRTSSQASNSVAGSVFGYGSKSTIGMSIAPSSNGSAASGMGTSTTNLVKDRMNAVSKPDDLMKKVFELIDLRLTKKA